MSVLRTTSLDFLKHNGIKIEYVDTDFEELANNERQNENNDAREFDTEEDLRLAEIAAKKRCKACREKFLSKAQSRAMNYLTEGYDKDEVVKMLGITNKTITNLYSQSRTKIKENCTGFCGKNIRNGNK